MFCIKWSNEEVTEPMKEGVKQGCNPRPYLLNIFIEDTVLLMQKMHVHQYWEMKLYLHCFLNCVYCAFCMYLQYITNRCTVYLILNCI
jgi:hypothetical protein